MHGTMEDIMGQMEHKFDIDLLKKIVYKKTHDVDSVLKIAMVAIFVIIAIVLVCVIKFGNKEKRIINNNVNKDDNIEICQDEKIINFVDNYFKARTDLRYDVIFNSFNKTFKNEMFNEEEKKIINSIRYERAYIKSYDNIKVFTYKGMRENEKVLIITYDMLFSYTTSYAPNIILSYVVYEDGKYYFRDNMDIGLSKYMNKVSQINDIKNLYIDTEKKLKKIVEENDDVKLSYNSLRQYKMNNYQKSDFNYVEEIMSIGIDPVADKEQIDEILNANKQKEVSTNPILKQYNQEK